MQLENLTPALKKNDRTEKANCRYLHILPNQKSLKGAFRDNYQYILMGYFLNNNVDLERVSMHSMFF